MRRDEGNPNLATSVCIVIAAFSLACDARTVSYERLADARGGWLETFAPSDARHIRSTHMVEDNRAWGTFQTSESNWLSRFDRGDEHQSVVIERPPRTDWWPKELTGGVTKKKAEAANFDVFIKEYRSSVGSTRLYVFVARESTTVYFHRTL